MVLLYPCIVEHQCGMVDVYGIPIFSCSVYEADKSGEAHGCRVMHCRVLHDRLCACSAGNCSGFVELFEGKWNTSIYVGRILPIWVFPLPVWLCDRDDGLPGLERKLG